MATPVIVLRFRDSTPGIDTIDEHAKLLSQRGAVWWGWWRKRTEDATATDVPAGPMGLVLTDRSTRRMFEAACERFSARGVDVNPDEVPEYYRRYIGDIEGFFRITSVNEVKYNEDLGEQIGERTMMRLGEPSVPVAAEHLAIATAAPNKSTILHLSDLHFGADYGFLVQGEKPQIGDNRRTLTECVVADLERIGLRNDIAAIFATGDFVTRGDWNNNARAAALKEFDALRGALGLSQRQIIAIPGNHDIVRYPDGVQVDVREFAIANQTNLQHEREFRNFVDELIDRNWKESLNYVRKISLNNIDVQVCALNSCTITGTKWHEYGYVGTSGIDAIHTLARMPIRKPTFRFLALHHHLLPVANVEAPNSQGVTLALDASIILSEAQAAGVHVALHGHQHKAKLALYSNLPLDGTTSGFPIHVVANGSAGAAINRLPSGDNNTYCVFTLEGEQLRLRMRELRTGGQLGMELFNNVLQTSPSAPK